MHWLLCFLIKRISIQHKCDLEIQIVTPVPPGGLSVASITGPVRSAYGEILGAYYYLHLYLHSVLCYGTTFAVLKGPDYTLATPPPLIGVLSYNFNAYDSPHHLLSQHLSVLISASSTKKAFWMEKWLHRNIYLFSLLSDYKVFYFFCRYLFTIA